MSDVDWTRVLIVVLQVLQLLGILAIVGGLWLLIHAGVRRTDNGARFVGPCEFCGAPAHAMGTPTCCDRCGHHLERGTTA